MRRHLSGDDPPLPFSCTPFPSPLHEILTRVCRPLCSVRGGEELCHGVVFVMSHGEKSHVEESCREGRAKRVMFPRKTVVSGGVGRTRVMSTVVFPRPRVAKAMPHDPCVHTCISAVSRRLCSLPATCKRGACDCKLPLLAQSCADPSR